VDQNCPPTNATAATARITPAASMVALPTWRRRVVRITRPYFDRLDDPADATSGFRRPGDPCPSPGSYAVSCRRPWPRGKGRSPKSVSRHRDLHHLGTRGDCPFARRRRADLHRAWRGLDPATNAVEPCARGWARPLIPGVRAWATSRRGRGLRWRNRWGPRPALRTRRAWRGTPSPWWSERRAGPPRPRPADRP